MAQRATLGRFGVFLSAATLVIILRSPASGELLILVFFFFSPPRMLLKVRSQNFTLTLFHCLLCTTAGRDLRASFKELYVSSAHTGSSSHSWRDKQGSAHMCLLFNSLSSFTHTSEISKTTFSTKTCSFTGNIPIYWVKSDRKIIQIIGCSNFSHTLLFSKLNII